MRTKELFSLAMGCIQLAKSIWTLSHFWAVVWRCAYLLGSLLFRSVQTGHCHCRATWSTFWGTPRCSSDLMRLLRLPCPVDRWMCWIFPSISFLSSLLICSSKSSSGISIASISSAGHATFWRSWRTRDQISDSTNTSTTRRTKAWVYRAVCAVCPASHLPLLWFFWHRRFICCAILSFVVAMLHPLQSIFMPSFVLSPTAHPWQVHFFNSSLAMNCVMISSCHASHLSDSSQCTWIPNSTASLATSMAPEYWHLALLRFSSKHCLCTSFLWLSLWRGQYGLHSQLIHRCTGRCCLSIFFAKETPEGVSRFPPFHSLTRMAEPFPKRRSTSSPKRLLG